MAKRPQACWRLLKPTSWQIQMPKYENSHVCVCGLFLGCLWQYGYCLFFFLWVNFPSLLLAKKTREYRSIYIFYYFNSIWLCGHLVNCIEAVLFNSWCYWYCFQNT
jgi:hypothetical protein